MFTPGDAKFKVICKFFKLYVFIDIYFKQKSKQKNKNKVPKKLVVSKPDVFKKQENKKNSDVFEEFEKQNHQLRQDFKNMSSENQLLLLQIKELVEKNENLRKINTNLSEKINLLN